MGLDCFYEGAVRAFGPRGPFSARVYLALGLLLMCANHAGAIADNCFLCGAAFRDEVYLITDHLTGRKEAICPKCADLKNDCFLCGMKVKDDPMRLEDGRVYCPRDAKAVVFTDEQMRQTVDEACEELTRSFSRFLTFPFARTTMSFVDRTAIETMFRSPGADQVCPDVYGYFKSSTNSEGRVGLEIYMLTGLPRNRVKATTAHEFTHAWLHEHLPADRTLKRETREGFCELVAYRLLQELGDERERQQILTNKYTRGQIDLFITADERHGFYNVVEWIKAGEDASLEANDLDRVRLLKPKPRPTPAVPAHLLASQPTPVSDTLTLKAILGTEARRLALINDRTLALNEEGKVRVGSSNVVVRLLEIRPGSVMVQVAGSAEKLELHLRRD